MHEYYARVWCKSVMQEYYSRVWCKTMMHDYDARELRICKRMMQEYDARLLCKSIMQVHNARVCCKSMMQEYDARSWCKRFMQEYDARVLCKSFMQVYNARVCCKSMMTMMQEYAAKVWWLWCKSIIQEFASVGAASGPVPASRPSASSLSPSPPPRSPSAPAIRRIRKPHLESHFSSPEIEYPCKICHIYKLFKGRVSSHAYAIQKN